MNSSNISDENPVSFATKDRCGVLLEREKVVALNDIQPESNVSDDRQKKTAKSPKRI